MARCGSRRSRQQCWRPAHIQTEFPGLRLGNSDRRESDDSATYTGRSHHQEAAMTFHIPKESLPLLAGKLGLVTGIANEHSIAYGCACAFRAGGASLAVTYLNEKAKPFVEPLARELGTELFLPLEVRDPAQMSAVFDAIRARWGRLDFLLHSMAFAPKADLQGRIVDSSVEGFLTAMDISCHSFVRMARLAEALMTDG